MQNDIKDRLLTVRLALQKTQTQMSNALQVSANAWNRWEKGTSAPRALSLTALTRYGIDPQWVASGQGSMWLETEDTPTTEGTPLGELNTQPLDALIGGWGVLPVEKPDKELIILLLQAIERACDEATFDLTMEMLGEILIDKYNAVMHLSNDPRDWPNLISMLEKQLKQDIINVCKRV